MEKEDRARREERELRKAVEARIRELEAKMQPKTPKPKMVMPKSILKAPFPRDSQYQASVRPHRDPTVRQVRFMQQDIDID